VRTWVYTWASSDGLKHEGEIQSPSKDEAFAALRKQGIHPIRVTERIQPIVRKGFRGLRKRDLWLLFLVVLFLVSVVAIVSLRTAPRVLSFRSRGAVALFDGARPRHYVALPQGLNIAQIFVHPSECYLARFAIPGEDVGVVVKMDEATQRDFYDSIDIPIPISPEDPASIVELKRIVVGMKDEARKYLNVPDGLKKLAIFLEERQSMERDYRKRMVGQVKSGAITLAEANDLLRAMGLKEIER